MRPRLIASEIPRPDRHHIRDGQASMRPRLIASEIGNYRTSTLCELVLQ